MLMNNLWDVKNLKKEKMAAPKDNKYALGNNGGRPRKITEKNLPTLAKKMAEWFVDEANNGNLPFFSKFAREVLGITERTLYNYYKEQEGKGEQGEFFLAYKKCSELQKEVIINNALRGKYNPTFAIFTAKNITDMRDVKELDHSSKGKPLSILNSLYVSDNNSDPEDSEAKEEDKSSAGRNISEQDD